MEIDKKLGSTYYFIVLIIEYIVRYSLGIDFISMYPIQSKVLFILPFSWVFIFAFFRALYTLSTYKTTKGKIIKVSEEKSNISTRIKYIIKIIFSDLQGEDIVITEEKSKLMDDKDILVFFNPNDSKMAFTKSLLNIWYTTFFHMIAMVMFSTYVIIFLKI